jgi:hypothetical protein
MPQKPRGKAPAGIFTVREHLTAAFGCACHDCSMWPLRRAASAGRTYTYAESNKP